MENDSKQASADSESTENSKILDVVESSENSDVPPAEEADTDAEEALEKTPEDTFETSGEVSNQDESTEGETEEEELSSQELLEQIEERLRDLATQSKKSMSKKARKEERKTFREIETYLREGILPEDELVLPGGSLTLTGFCVAVSLSFFRRILGGALQFQLKQNSFLIDLLAIDESLLAAEPGSERMDPLEKRLFVSKSSRQSKNQTEQRKRERAERRNQQNLFLDND